MALLSTSSVKKLVTLTISSISARNLINAVDISMELLWVYFFVKLRFSVEWLVGFVSVGILPPFVLVEIFGVGWRCGLPSLLFVLCVRNLIKFY